MKGCEQVYERAYGCAKVRERERKSEKPFCCFIRLPYSMVHAFMESNIHIEECQNDVAATVDIAASSQNQWLQ